MDIDSDEPPSLVEVNTSHADPAPDPTTTQLKDLSITKVPLTIVTGIPSQRTTAAFQVPMLNYTTGYLGAGKTTLVNYILKQQHGKRIAVILNGLYTPHPLPPNPPSPAPPNPYPLQNSETPPISKKPSQYPTPGSPRRNGSSSATAASAAPSKTAASTPSNRSWIVAAALIISC